MKKENDKKRLNPESLNLGAIVMNAEKTVNKFMPWLKKTKNRSRTRIFREEKNFLSRWSKKGDRL